MNVSEISQKNCRLKFWLQSLKEGRLSVAQNAELEVYIKSYREVLNYIIRDTNSSNGIISEEVNLKLLDLERKIEGLTEIARLESARSKLLF